MMPFAPSAAPSGPAGDPRMDAKRKILDDLLKHVQGGMAGALRGGGGAPDQTQPEGVPHAETDDGTEKSVLGPDGLPSDAPESAPLDAQALAGGAAGGGEAGEEQLDPETLQKLLALIGGE